MTEVHRGARHAVSAALAARAAEANQRALSRYVAERNGNAIPRHFVSAVCLFRIAATYSITDIDLRLYIRASSVARETTVVDIKNRRTPLAIERIFGAKGLQSALGVDRAIVGTSGSRRLQDLPASRKPRGSDGPLVNFIVNKNE